MPNKAEDIFFLVRQINILWKDVYPYLARHIIEVYGRGGGRAIEMGPFCGVIHELVRQGTGDSFCIASFPGPMKGFYIDEVENHGQADAIAVINTDPRLKGIDDSSCDLIIFRGALFFPEFFTVDYQALKRVLKPEGLAFVGGGFGKYTPPDVISPIAGLSRKLNLLIGKKEVNINTVLKDLEENGMAGCAEIEKQGGLWIIIRK